jgi:uncharacterized membrane protein
MYMPDELTTIYHILKALVWAIVGILIAIFALLAFAIVTPVVLRGLLESSTVSESIREAARSLMAGLGGLGSAVLGLMIAFIVILVIIAIGLEMLKTTPWRHVKVTDEAFETLRMRYAKGEITKEQFLEMKKALETGA